MSLKFFFPAILLIILSSCSKPDNAAKNGVTVDPTFAEGIKAMLYGRLQCDPGTKTTHMTDSKIDISAEGTVNDSSSVLAIFIDYDPNKAEACKELIYYGPFKENIMTRKFNLDEEAKYFFDVMLIDTMQGLRYSWSPEYSVPVKAEMKMHLLHNNDPSSKQIEFN